MKHFCSWMKNYTFKRRNFRRLPSVHALVILYFEHVISKVFAELKLVDVRLRTQLFRTSQTNRQVCKLCTNTYKNYISCFLSLVCKSYVILHIIISNKYLKGTLRLHKFLVFSFQRRIPFCALLQLINQTANRQNLECKDIYTFISVLDKITCIFKKLFKEFEIKLSTLHDLPYYI